ncbi:MAG: SDR family NAD(P)-dependent oxidoreductase [Moorea sp. SIOASIH]|uniref:VatU n=1 Tax=Moorena producens ASI16Jul14-2 TaxID=2546228 RepID=A0A4P8JD96_9CYAN|nr:type I polyketide synthase [Moorena sp. SIOASIH]NEO38501.1 SDR family NAD(P)-dependent oxidoreductase [Moorena sp. SIOASIH]QCP68970.1 VatU [Moorena producens ASI16Jul14-2]
MELNSPKKQLSNEQLLLLKIEQATAKLQEIKTAATEPIAIIGMGCRFPGGASTPEAFWDILQNGVDAITEVPKDRWHLDDYYNPDPDTPGKMYSRHGGFIDQIQEFDANFFAISPKETIHLDPQQRLLLEVSWEALENSGKNPQQLKGSQTGVFIGICGNDYTQRIFSQGSEKFDAYAATGNTHGTASGRISYTLGLIGPNLALNTACSSSLVTIHLACSSLRNQECNMALAGGVNLLISPEVSISFSKARMLSVDGRCKTFDISANGFVRGEGCGIVVLKRLSDALADQDNILAVIRGSAINQDGDTSGLTVPNGPSQQSVIRQALTNGGVQPANVSYIEAHGTGTSLGDPIEVEAIGTVFGKTHSQEKPLVIGSVKTNIGHLEGAAGIAGLMKLVLQLQHQQIAPSLHFNQPNPYINWSQLPVKISTKLTPWQTNGKTRIAGVSSFGFSGTNAHIILEEAPVKFKIQDELERSLHLLTLSAKTETALSELASSYHNYLKTHPELKVADICHTANTGRAQFNHRLAVVAQNQQDLVEKLRQQEQGEEVAGIFSAELLNNTTAPKIAFLFTGQGSQYVNMGRQLYQQAPTFREAINQCEQILSTVETFQDKSLRDILYPGDDSSGSSLLDQTAYTQPVLFAIEYALFKLWQSWGIKPDVVMGHSVGEYVAATVAGVFSLEDGLKLIAVRGSLMQKLPAGGEMVSVMASKSKVLETLNAMSLEEKVAIAAINGLQSIVISGDSEAVRAIATNLESEGIKSKQLQVSHAFHSPLMEPMLAEFEAVANQLTYNQPRIPLISNITGTRADKSIATAKYWVNHVCQPVRFADSMKTLYQEGYELFLEIGSKPILLGMGRQCLPEEVGAWLPSLRPGVDEWQQMLWSLGDLYVQGAKVDWLGFDQDYSREKVALPTYPFQREMYWIDTPENQHKKFTTESGSSPIVDLLNQGNTESLTKELYLAAQLTEDEEKLLPKLLNTLVNRHQSYIQFKGNVVYDYYNSATKFTKEQFKVADNSNKVNSLRFLTFGIFTEIIPNFSWMNFLASTNQEEFSQVALDSQKELRELCFLEVDFLNRHKVLDFGCGYGSDLITLAQTYPHLQLNGYTISSEQAKFATDQVSTYQLQDRIQVFNRDSSKDEFPDSYDLIFGFEVAHHIENKNDLFWNISNHLREEGLLVLADFIASGNSDINHDETSSYFITKQHWIEQLSEKHLQLISAIDVSLEIANFLYDPEFDEIIDDAYQKNNDEHLRSAMQSYNQLGKLLKKGLASYVLLTAKKQKNQPKEKICHSNQEILSKLLSYSEVAVKQWIYELKWKPSKDINQESILLTHQNAPGTWLLFVDSDFTGQELATILEGHNKHCLLIYPGHNYQKLDQQHYQVNPTNPQEFEQLLQELLTAPVKLEGIVHLWNLNTSTEDLESAQELGCGSVLHLVQGLASNPEYPVALWLVTQGTQSVEQNSHMSQVQQVPVWGLGRVIAVEHPELQCRCVDLDPTSGSSEALQTLAKELLHPDTEDQIAIRRGVRHVARLVRRLDNSNLEQQQQVTLKPEGCYLITGGLGALGLELAQWMVQQGAKHLVLTGRSAPSEKAVQIIKQLEQTEAEISVLLGDISQKQDVAGILDQIQESLPPLKGVIHAAGVLDDGVLQQMSWERFTKVMAPKVQGTWYLHQLTQDLHLDFFVCFSSMASLLGSPGQGNYAAANAFMDGIAHYRRGIGLPGLTINWGAWGQGGMAARMTSQNQNRLQNTGISSIAPEKGLQLLGQLLSQSVSQVGVFPVNWSQFFAQLSDGVQIPLFLEAFASTKLAKNPKNEEFLGELAAATESECNQLMIDYLQVKVGKLLGFSKSQLPDEQLGFFDMGMDSLMAVELRNVLSSSLGCSITAATLFDASTIQDLAKYLINALFPEDTSIKIKSGNSKNTQRLNIVDSEWETQSESEIEEAIAQQLEEIDTILNEGN